MPTAVDLDVRVEVDQLGQFVVAQNRLRQHDLAAGVLVRVEQITFSAGGSLQAGHHLFADGVQRRVGHLGEQLLEVVEQHPRPLGEHRNRSVGPHRADRLGAGARHRRHQQVELFVGVAENQLPQDNSMVRHPHVVALGQLGQRNQPVVQPLLIGVFGGQLGLDLLVGHDAALRGVDQKHPAWLQPHPAHHRRRVEVKHAGLGGHHHQTVVSDPNPGRP